MKRIRFTTLRTSRKYGAGLWVAVILAAGGLFFEAKAQSKKPSTVPKSPAREKAKPETKPAKSPAGERPPASDDLYEGPAVADPAAKKTPVKPAAPSGEPVSAPPAATAGDSKHYGAKYADAWPSEYRPAPPDLLPNQKDENSAAAIAEYAEAEFQLERGNADKALKGFRKASALDPADPRLAIMVARELLITNDPTAAIEVIKDSIAASPKEPKTHIYLARIYADHLNKSDLARQYAEKALELAPDYFPVWKALLDFSADDASGKRLPNSLSAR